MLALADELGAAHVGRQHGLFNQTVRFVAGAGHNFFNSASFVAQNLSFGGFKVHCPSPRPCRQQGAVHVRQINQVFHQRLAPLRLWAMGVGQNGSHFGVGEAGMAVHHRRVKLVRRHLAFMRHKHVTHHAQALHIGVERAQTIGELFRQHRNNAPRKVHAGGALISVHIDRRTRFHIVADICNGHQQAPALHRMLAPALGCRFAIHRVVKISSVFTINGDQGHVGQIHPVFLILWPHLIGQSTRLGNTSF